LILSMAWAAVCCTSPTPRMREPKDELLLGSRRSTSKAGTVFRSDWDTFSNKAGEPPRMDFACASTTLFSTRQKLVATAAVNVIVLIRFFMFILPLGFWNSIVVSGFRTRVSPSS
jgi:hypothetical protein